MKKSNYPDIIIPTCKSAEQIAPLMCNLEGFSQGCRVIATCETDSAAKNRNKGLAAATADIIIMVDDDIAGYYDGWWNDLTAPLKDPDVVLVSARLMDRQGLPGACMFAGDVTAQGNTIVPRVPTACIAFRARDVEHIRFDENYVGSGFEDDDFCAQLFMQNPYGKVVITNTCKMIHVNEQKNQGGKYFTENKKLFESKWRSIRNEEMRVNHYWNIPRILHFVWIGGPLPSWGEANIREFKRLNPEFTVMVHGEEILNPLLKKAWDKIDHKEHGLAIKSDLLRLSALLKHGGWYFDTDFWPLVPIKTLCSHLDDLYQKCLLFASPDKKICANGILACSSDALGLSLLVAGVLSRTEARPEWWDYGTRCTRDALLAHPELYCVQPLAKVIPVTGKKGALDALRKRESIEKIKTAGAWAIHMEMTTTTDTGGELCTTANLVKTNS